MIATTLRPSEEFTTKATNPGSAPLRSEVPPPTGLQRTLATRGRELMETRRRILRNIRLRLKYPAAVSPGTSL